MTLLIKRLHDNIYLHENNYENPKESFKLLINLIKKNHKKTNIEILDIGCSNGELIYNLNKNFKDASVTGLDINKRLLKKAKQNTNKKNEFIHMDFSKKNIILKKYDLIIMAGVLAIFDNPTTILKNIKRNLKKNGNIYLFGNFNFHPINIYLKYEDFNNKKNILQSGFNIFSIKYIEKNFAKKNIQITSFFINKKIKKNPNDLLRSWTEKHKGKNYFINGLDFYQKQMWVRIF